MNRNNQSPDISEVLNVRSDEKIVIIGNDTDYDPDWVVLGAGTHDDVIDSTSVVVVDRVALPRDTIVSIVSSAPRMLAFVTGEGPAAIVYDKQVRRLLSSLYPWSEVYTFMSSFGRVIAMWTAPGQQPYDRDRVLDARPQTQA